MAALDDSKRADKLRGLLTRLKQNKTVQNRDLRTWLGDAAYVAYERDWAEQQSLRVELRDKPSEIVEYERLMKSASFIYNKADALSSRGHSETALKMFGAADDAFERLHEYLAIALARDGAVAWWFDRDVYAEHGLTPDSVPRVITSKSL